MKIKTLKEIPELKGKKILIRVDYNVPLDNKGEIEDDSRIMASIPTIKHLLENGASLIIMSHLGRPKGKINENLRLNKIASHLENILKQKIKKMDEVLSDEVM
ncbi:phosphoglycerate kinase, partial [Candidatus Peregrinibacteria bacterium]|nr:phosphoglycerate kinase [Candidatus Peregrinibacteria bacterium]